MYFVAGKKFQKMLQRTLAPYTAFVFLGLLSSVVGHEGFRPNDLDYDSLPFFRSNVREEYLEHGDLLPYGYRDSTSSDPSSDPKQTDKRTPENKREISENSFQENISVEVPFNHPQNMPYRLLGGLRRKSPVARGYKRGPGFRSWGGKRDWTTEHPSEEKRGFHLLNRHREFSPDDDQFGNQWTGVEGSGRTGYNWGGKKSAADVLEDLDDVQMGRGPSSAGRTVLLPFGKPPRHTLARYL